MQRAFAMQRPRKDAAVGKPDRSRIEHRCLSLEVEEQPVIERLHLPEQSEHTNSSEAARCRRARDACGWSARWFAHVHVQHVHAHEHAHEHEHEHEHEVRVMWLSKVI